MKNQRLMVWLFLLCFTTFSQRIKLTIAVNDLSAKGILQSDAEIISERLRSELINTGAFKVMERNDMASILKEQGFQKTGACDEASCLVEVGQLLGVERMVAGSVGKIASIHTVSLRLINVATGEIMFTVNEDYSGDLTGVLTKAVANAARKLAGGAGVEIEKAALVGKTGDLYVSTIPIGAIVEIDGKKIDGETPLTLKGIDAGEHRIVVRKDEFYGSRKVILAPEDLAKVEIIMEKGRGALKVFVKPDGAEVHIDGIRMGTTPCKIDELTAGEHEIKIVKEGYLLQKSTFVIVAGQVENLSAALKEAGYVSVNCDKAEARILINGIEAGRGSIERLLVGAGIIKVAVEASGYEPFNDEVTITQGDHQIIQVQLVSVFGTLGISSVPRGATVYLNEQKVGKTPYTNDHLQPGNYQLKIMLDTYETIQEDVDIAKNCIMSKKYELKHTAFYLDSIKTVSARLKKHRQWGRRIVFGSLAAAMVGGGLYFNKRTSNAALVYNSYTGYDSNKHTENWHTYKKQQIIRNVFCGLAGTCAVGLTLSIPF